MVDEGYEFKGIGGDLKVTMWSMIFFRGVKKNGLYFLKGVRKKLVAVMGETSEVSHLEVWHKKSPTLVRKGCKNCKNKFYLGT